MSPALERWAVGASAQIAKWILRSLTVQELREGLDRASGHLTFLNERERSFLRDGAEAVARDVAARFGFRRSNQAGYVPPDRMRVAQIMSRSTVQGKLERVANQMDRRLQLKAKSVRVSKTLEDGRKRVGTGFYLSTWHQRPADGHRAFQGQLYVDRMWRTALESAGYAFFIPMAEAKIREEGIKTVQWVMGPPAYLVTRPYCRHMFVPIPIHEAMFLPLSEIKARHPEAQDHAHRALTDAQRRMKAAQRRLRVKRKIIGEKEKSGA